jgi:Ankyrin repeats (3 copies)
MQLFFRLIVLLCLAIATLPAHAITLSEELAYRVRFSRADDVDLLLRKGADPDSTNEVGLPMVSVATSRTDADAIPVLKTLMKHGADMNRGGVNNQYPVIIAARENNTTLMRFLIEEAKVDYTVKDLNGMLPLEIAEYYGNDASADMIRALTEEKLAAERERKSPERRDALIKKLAYGTCEQAYMYYYYMSKQDKHPKEKIASEITRYRQAVKDDIDELYVVFGVPVELALSMQKAITPPLTAELNAMISNRQRRHVGVGTQKDLNARCDRLAGAWLKEHAGDAVVQEPAKGGAGGF